MGKVMVLLKGCHNSGQTERPRLSGKHLPINLTKELLATRLGIMEWTAIYRILISALNKRLDQLVLHRPKPFERVRESFSRCQVPRNFLIELCVYFQSCVVGF